MDQYITLSCTISDGDLPLSIFWTFNGSPVTPEIEVLVSKLGKRSSVLTVESVRAHHAGNYSCHGENIAGSTVYSTELKVIGSFEKPISFCLFLILFLFYLIQVLFHTIPPPTTQP